MGFQAKRENGGESYGVKMEESGVYLKGAKINFFVLKQNHILTR